MYLVLVRHGQSVWNLENRFTGWTDVELSENGVNEAHAIGKKLKSLGIMYGIAYTSSLIRAQKTLDYILEELGQIVKTRSSYKLNERHYGALQGLNKEETAQKYGADQVQKWRRSYDVKPPELAITDPRFPGNDPKYSDILKFELPLTESLKDTYERVVDYFEHEISTFLRVDENVLIAAHGNSLRALVKYLEDISDEDIPNVEIATGSALIYELDSNLKVLKKTIIEP